MPKYPIKLQIHLLLYLYVLQNLLHTLQLLHPPNKLENSKIPSTATNSTIPISSPCAAGSPSTSKFVALSTTVTLPTGHPMETNPVVNTTVHNMVTYPIATFSACSGQPFQSYAPTVTLPISNTVENMAAVLTTSVSNTNMYNHQ